MSSFETAQVVHAYRERCEDRIEITTDGDRTVIVVADGAGGTGGGHFAAETVLRETRSSLASIDGSTGWSDFLSQLDFEITCGETTAVIVDLRPDRIIGASVGDSCAWIIDGSSITDLTRNQCRKPLLGSQAAKPAPFWHGSLDGTLLVGSDGFFDYAKRDQITTLIGRTDLFSLPRACVDLVRLPSGDLWDDTAVVACRVRYAQSPRKRYSI
ncbi:protein phosphatase 2C domain-containing protein [Rhodopirellula bahusiensis]|uniref:Serine/threonine protein phosphatase n=1 Tax=Rhodopirellula bahusiensis TaxID=2014065 RepID=A0A2G1W850_9BACT|nr:protein phosphatase 2C domain-containing protein [Rhodopirellula bahusiensis]PHQ35191.1 serine/threonine protein phosphatase [Rhodopirellula bahusiensis]